MNITSHCIKYISYETMYLELVMIIFSNNTGLIFLIGNWKSKLLQKTKKPWTNSISVKKIPTKRSQLQYKITLMKQIKITNTQESDWSYIGGRWRHISEFHVVVYQCKSSFPFLRVLYSFISIYIDIIA